MPRTLVRYTMIPGNSGQMRVLQEKSEEANSLAIRMAKAVNASRVVAHNQYGPIGYMLVEASVEEVANRIDQFAPKTGERGYFTNIKEDWSVRDYTPQGSKTAQRVISNDGEKWSIHFIIAGVDEALAFAKPSPNLTNAHYVIGIGLHVLGLSRFCDEANKIYKGTSCRTVDDDYREIYTGPASSATLPFLQPKTVDQPSVTPQPPSVPPQPRPPVPDIPPPAQGFLGGMGAGTLVILGILGYFLWKSGKLQGIIDFIKSKMGR